MSRISRVWVEIVMELKGLRIYRLQLIINLLILPLSYALIALLVGGMTQTDLSYLLSGLIVSSFIGSFVGLLAMRISNFTQPQTMELYAAMPVTTGEVFSGLAITYLLLALPQIIVLLGLSIWQAETPRVGLAILGVLMSSGTFVSLGVFLGALVRNPFKAQGVFPLVSWGLMLLSPIYYNNQHLPAFYSALLLVNPATHALNVIRPFLGFKSVMDIGYSFLYLGLFILVTAFASYYILRRRMHLLEKFF